MLLRLGWIPLLQYAFLFLRWRIGSVIDVIDLDLLKMLGKSLSQIFLKCASTMLGSKKKSPNITLKQYPSFHHLVPLAWYLYVKKFPPVLALMDVLYVGSPSTWRISPLGNPGSLSTVVLSAAICIYMNQPYLGDLLTLVMNHVLSIEMIMMISKSLS